MIQDIAPHKYYAPAFFPNDTDLVLIFITQFCAISSIFKSATLFAEICFSEIKEKAKFLFRIDETDYYELRSEASAFGI